jgi:hypothetical protein
MTDKGSGRGFHYWLRRFFVVWAIVSTAWFVNLFRTQGVPAALLHDDDRVAVRESNETLALLPSDAAPAGAGNSRAAGGSSALVFICGGGVAAEAYVPLLRAVAERGHPVHIVRLPYRLAPLEGHKRTAVERARNVIAANPAIDRWVIAGHSLGGALATRLAADPPEKLVAVVLIGTSHPRELDLSATSLAVTKVFASNDGIATPQMIHATGDLLPAGTHWVEIEGGNHSQFGHYGHQLFDGTATVARERQQDLTREALLRALQTPRGPAAGPDPGPERW